jgi:hypothetical protein
MKYFLLSAFSSCLLLLGIGLIYWQTGLTRLSSLQELTTYTSSFGNYDSQSEMLPVISENSMAGLPQETLGIWLGLWLIGLALLWKLA